MTPEPTNTPQVDTASQPATPAPTSRRGRKVALIVVGVIVGLLVVFGVALAIFLNSGARSLQGSAASNNPDAVEFEGRTYVPNPNMVSILIMGLDDDYKQLAYKGIQGRWGARCSDANLLVTVDTESGNITVIAIPRDSEADVDLYVNGEKTVTKPLQLCLAYSTDCGSEEACAANTALSVSRLLGGITVDRYFTLDMSAFIDATTKMGGVHLTALETIPQAGTVAGQEITLSGRPAYMYVLERTHEFNGANLRLERQRQFLYAFVSQLRSRSAGEILDVYNTVKGQTNTNLSANEIAWLASILASSEGSFESVTLPGEVRELTDDDGELREHVFLDETEIQRIMLDVLYEMTE